MSNEQNTYRIGDAVVTRILETAVGEVSPAQLYPNWKDYNSDATAETAPSIMLQVAIWVVRYAGEVALVDTGIGNHKDRPFNAAFHRLNTPFLERLEQIGVHPEDVSRVLLTHLHTDHVGWNTRLKDGAWVPTFPSATYVMPLVEREFHESPAAAARRMVFDDSVAPVLAAAPVEFIPEQGIEHRPGLTFVPTPGHSPGHMSIRLRSKGEEAIFTGDIFHAPEQIRQPELVSIYCADAERSRLSRRHILDHAARYGSRLFTPHFAKTSAGIVAASGDGWEWNWL